MFNMEYFYILVVEKKSEENILLYNYIWLDIRKLLRVFWS